MPIQANYANNCARDVEFSWFDGGEDRKHKSISFVEISEILTKQDDFSTALFDRVQCIRCKHMNLIPSCRLCSMKTFVFLASGLLKLVYWPALSIWPNPRLDKYFTCLLC